MGTWEAIGYVASSLVLTAFGMKNIIPLRVVAMCSNVMFKMRTTSQQRKVPIRRTFATD